VQSAFGSTELILPRSVPPSKKPPPEYQSDGGFVEEQVIAGIAGIS
jgi:hypothetical protein